ncbi:hypothetical protein MHJ63_03810 [Pseudoglutamicibacter albus]|uniref:XTP/dITP diphosphohydrolase n=1 Tax=Pseudoglutamicibacter albus TaxID=98671 RepID=A0ABU1YZ65_9MICC|nr:MazG nucleotide pyrophosphohydrolase domain-containing protein [Pseudoglutamicibacter albus]MCG7304405.1 hypothetical protein [Pseudoglutamicibacter albus]MDR7293056.1 XTP/dITP diphosphohydrolase [Pseudoglutamicibacter albus]
MNPDDEKVTAALERARGIVRLLRSECGWTSALTPQKLAPYLIEEAHEVHDAVASEAPDADLVSELGDVLFQILLHAELGRERGAFDLDDIADALSEKLLRRNTHLFNADGSMRSDPQRSAEAAEAAWAEAKRKEKSAPS